MALIAQLIANGLIAGSIYALVACGFSLIYSTNKFMHFAHGITVVVSSYILYTLFSLLDFQFIPAVILTIAFAGLFGYLINKLIYQPLQKRGASSVILLIASVAILTLFQNLILMVFGSSIKSLNYLQITRGMNIFGASVTKLQIIIMLVSLILLASLYFFMKKTKLGRDMRAIADDKELSSIVGIDHIKISNYSFLIGSSIAGIAGIFIALEQNISPTIGTNLIIKGFTGAIVGGITSVPGSIIGSYIIGLAENLGIAILPSGYKDAIAFIILFLFLLFKPNGLFGINKGVKK